MKHFNTTKIFKALLVFTCLIAFLFIGLLISVNFIVDPIIYWLASTEGARIFIGIVLSWFGLSTIFDLYYNYYKHRQRNKRFNALDVPYPRIFKGRK